MLQSFVNLVQYVLGDCVDGLAAMSLHCFIVQHHVLAECLSDAGAHRSGHYH